ncbi:MAG: orotidine-5'-phosphate decarboxylase [Sphaerochaetaceae bacterium]|nr:orotidine-5'-phosphate decarboxylase [Sphaerochaetaceae bacterium]
MNYIQLLRESAKEVGNCGCLGIDPNFSALPEGMNVKDFYLTLFEAMDKKGLKVAAIKPNIGYFSRLDKPLEGKFEGSLALAEIIKALPAKPFILDAKRGDIATSSANYAYEAFKVWNADCVTVSPYMGTDSVTPFAKGYEDKGVYVLNRTSNPGGKDLQNVQCESNNPVYMEVAKLISNWNTEYSCGIGAVVGATNLKELEDLASFYSTKSVPMLIPGVGSQGGSATDVMAIMRKVGYPVELGRINSSSALTHPWAKKKEQAPSNWIDVCLKAIEDFIKECSC